MPAVLIVSSRPAHCAAAFLRQFSPEEIGRGTPQDKNPALNLS
jgi:hypothetical protein